MAITADTAGRFSLGDREVNRMGYGAMQLAGPHVMGPPADRKAAVAVLRRAVELGVDHIDTSDYYGPYVTNEIIREALHPYPEDLVLVTKIGARRTPDGAWPEALSADELRQAVHDNLGRLGLDVLEVVNLRMPGFAGPDGRSVTEPMEALAQLQSEGLVRHIGVSNVDTQQLADARAIAPVVCVQNHYNLVHRDDDAMVDALARDGIAYVPFFPLGGFSPLQSAALEQVARTLETTPMQVALAWLLQRSPNVLLIPGTSSVAHLEANLEAGAHRLGPVELEALEQIGGPGTAPA
ncbi:oxidoreductase [Modestobacter sp. I12A-02628]|uniref:Oxidoreductase n=1 Tax=Goekera deserti TaxID=2497753 RepID=A0A7K3WEF9_9ACTN|nr:oxidoreductase [Goekera deserti]MPQ98337.1 oxidoreductase [Goekera deserti]NDI48164.1 oxidoreductase [Goekera deserti]NEL53913.1 oxidoreductase [Goekera deserti]